MANESADKDIDEVEEMPISVTPDAVIDNIDSSFPTQLPKTIGEARGPQPSDVGVADFIPEGGWMAWERNMYMSGRMHQTLHTIANHAINFKLHPAVELPPPKIKPPTPPPPVIVAPVAPPQPPTDKAGQEPQPTPIEKGAVKENLENIDNAFGEPLPSTPPKVGASAPETQEEIPPELIKRAQLAAEDAHYLKDVCEQFNLEQCLKVASVYRDAFGIGALYPVYDRIPDPTHPLGFYLGNLKKMRILDSTKLQVVRDNVFDLRQLYTFFPGIPPKLEKMGKPARPNNTGRIIGFILTISADTRTKLIDATGDEIKPDVWARLMPGMDEMSIDYTRVFYYDDELIVFFRDASAMFPDGVSLLRANYTMIENKLMLDRVAVTGYAKSVIPTWIVSLPPGMKQFVSDVQHELQRSRANPGSDIVLMSHDGLDIKRSIADGLQSAEPLLSYMEDQYNAGFGIFDTMSNSASANRATAEIQSDLFMRMIEPLRKDVEKTITTRLFMPLLERKHGLTPSSIMQTPASEIAGIPDDPQQVPRQDVIPTGDKPYLLPKWEWGALIDSDKNALLTAFAPFLNAMSQDQIDFVLENFGGLPKRLGEPSGIIAKQQALDQLRMNINAPSQAAPQPTAPEPQKPPGATGTNPNPPKAATTSTQSTGTGPTSKHVGSPSGRDSLLTEEDVFRTLNERRKTDKLPPLKKGGDIIPIPDNYVLYDPDTEI